MIGTGGKLGAILLFWLAVGLIQTFNWGNGVPKAVVMLLVLAAVPLVLRAARQATPLSPGFARAITLAFWLALALDLIYFGTRIVAPHVIDIATTTLAAGQALLHGANPYALPLDTGPESAGFTGYKYLPVMIAAYLPLGALFGERGVLLTNLIVLLGAVALMRRIAGTRPDHDRAGWNRARFHFARESWSEFFNREHDSRIEKKPGASFRYDRALAPLLLLMLPLVAEQIFAKGATDLLAVLPLLGALALIERGSFWCGLLVGLSIASKLLPGIAVLPALIPPQCRGRYLAGVIVGLAPIVPFIAWDPSSFIANIVLFNLARGADDTSWLHAMPPAVATATHLAFVAAILGLAVAIWRRPPPLAARCALAAMLALGAILAGPGAHHNYQLWWLPFAALLLSLALAPAGRFGYTSDANIAAKGV